MTEKKKRICFVNTVSCWGGGEKWHYEATLQLQKEDYEIFFLTHPNSVLSKKLKAANVKTFLIKIKKNSWLNPFKIKKITRLFIEHRIDTVIINSSPDVKACGLAAHKAGCRKIIYRRGSARPIKNTIINRRVFGKWLTDVLANSEATKKSINAINPAMFPEEKIKVIYNPIDTTPFLENKIHNQPVKNDVIVIGNLARLAKQKNQIFLIRLASKLKEQGVQFKIIIGGTGSLQAELEHEIQKEQLTHEVKLLGFQKNAIQFMNRCDIFLLPSLWEGFGYAIAEASLCCKPVIAFNVSSNPEVIINNKTGFLTGVNDIEDTIKKIKLFAEDNELAQSMGNNGFAYCNKMFNKEHIYNQLTEYLNK
ncbi:MAG: glycosyltransferase [Niabella sp.]